MKKILFYITGHGFGHATRTIEVINRLHATERRFQPLISTTVPEWLFRREVDGDLQYVLCDHDVGAVQKDWRRVDKLATLTRYAALIEREPELVKEQAALARRERVAAVVSDIPAVAFLVAEAAGVPSLAITNFSWDWICAPYLEEYPEYRFVVEHLRECYGKADRLLRLPYHGDLSAFPVIEDIPLVARHATLEREEVLRRLNLDEVKTIVLLYLGKDFDPETVLSGEMRRRSDLLFISFGALDGGGVRSQDLVSAADVVVTKPGYGIVSDCIANQTPVLYTDRQDFAEYDALVDGLEKHALSRFVPGEDLLSGRWLPHLDALLATDYCWPDLPTNGAEIAATKLQELL